ncbi:Phosphatidylinositol 3,4,5-trisphosphate 3-phosphatase and protein-tyrosine-phosphatase PTEN2A [Linum perenne]
MMDSESADSVSPSQPPNGKTQSTIEPHVIASNVESSDKGPTTEPSDPKGITPDHSTEESQYTSVGSKDVNTGLPEPRPPEYSMTSNSSASTLSRITSGLGLHLLAMTSGSEEPVKGSETAGQSSVLESVTKGIVDSSRDAVKAIQVKARHAVSQNKRRYQEGEFDLDMAYITENIIAMGFPAGDLSSGLFGFFEGLYRNHMEEVIRFFETHHKGKYKVYNLCSERLYDASRFEGKVACFPFDDHNCPPLQLITLFCQSAYSWLKEDIENVVVVHCKAGMGRTGLMICSLLLYLKFFPNADEAIDVFNQKRCVDGKALVLSSQIRYVKYFERVLTYFNGENQPGRKCMLRGFRFHKCPYWIRPSITISNHIGVLFSTRKHPKTKDLMPEDFWISARKKGIVVFALPGEPGLTKLLGDFKIQFHDRHGDFYCWLNTTMIENRKTLSGDEFDGFDKRKLPSPGFEVEIVMIDYDGTSVARKKGYSNNKGPNSVSMMSKQKKAYENNEDDLFSDSDGEETEATKKKQKQSVSEAFPQASSEMDNSMVEQMTNSSEGMKPVSSNTRESCQANTIKEKPDTIVETLSRRIETTKLDSGASDIKAMAADASVFSFGDEDEFESD